MRFRPLAGPASLLAFAASLAAVPTARAAYTVTFSQVGPDVVASGSGTIDTNGLTLVDSGPIVPQVGATFSVETAGAAGLINGYVTVSGPTNGFGPGVITTATSGTGDPVGIEADLGVNGFLYAPLGYVSGAPLSDTATYDNQTFASLDLTPGTYVYSSGSGADADTFTVQTGATSVPKPVSLALLGTGILGLGFTARSRRKAA